MNGVRLGKDLGVGKTVAHQFIQPHRCQRQRTMPASALASKVRPSTIQGDAPQFFELTGVVFPVSGC